MTLFDGKPLTEEEVSDRQKPCRCSHAWDEHYMDDNACAVRVCDCAGFQTEGER